MTVYVQMIHRTSSRPAGSWGIVDDDRPADWAEPFATLEEAMSYANEQAAQVKPELEPKPADMWTFGVWPYAIERPVWEVYEEPEPDTPEREDWDGSAKVYDIIDPLEPMEDLRELLEGTGKGYGSIRDQLAYDLGEEVDLCAEVAEQLEEDAPERQTIERRKLSLVPFRSDLAPSGRSWALLEDGRCCGLLGGLETMHPSAYDALRADWWSANDCDLSTAQGKEAVIIFAIIADVVSWR